MKTIPEEVQEQLSKEVDLEKALKKAQELLTYSEKQNHVA
ncbi:hypothetical protein SAMN02910298_01783 [Pseudobutyrivibrio sp. YE44]|nr:hypothetical protein SAMN02910298_01783 [Pseudobutyrivibrio sp. YE44]